MGNSYVSGDDEIERLVNSWGGLRNQSESHYHYEQMIKRGLKNNINLLNPGILMTTFNFFQSYYSGPKVFCSGY